MNFQSSHSDVGSVQESFSGWGAAGKDNELTGPGAGGWDLSLDPSAAEWLAAIPCPHDDIVVDLCYVYLSDNYRKMSRLAGRWIYLLSSETGSCSPGSLRAH